MFKLFRPDPAKKLERQFAQKLEQAQRAQRDANMPLFAKLTAEAEVIGQRLDTLKQDGEIH